jgi:hypothetical protein
MRTTSWVLLRWCLRKPRARDRREPTRKRAWESAGKRGREGPSGRLRGRLLRLRLLRLLRILLLRLLRILLLRLLSVLLLLGVRLLPVGLLRVLLRRWLLRRASCDHRDQSDGREGEEHVAHGLLLHSACFR